MGLQGVTVESISGGEIGTSHWTGKQGAAAVVAAEERQHGNLEWLLPARQDMKGVLDSGAWPYWGELFEIRAAGFSFILLHILYKLRTNVWRWSQLNN